MFFICAEKSLYDKRKEQRNASLTCCDYCAGPGAVNSSRVCRCAEEAELRGIRDRYRRHRARRPVLYDVPDIRCPKRWFAAMERDADCQRFSRPHVGPARQRVGARPPVRQPVLGFSAGFTRRRDDAALHSRRRALCARHDRHAPGRLRQEWLDHRLCPRRRAYKSREYLNN
jgi:hypothetical protein